MSTTFSHLADTEISQLESKLSTTRYHLETQRTLADASFEAIVLFDENLCCMECNQTALDMFGYTKSEIIGEHVLTFLAPESRETAKASLAKDTRSAYNAEALRKDGTVFPVHIKGAYISFQGRIVRLAAARDITEIVQSQAALKQAHSELESVFNNSMVGMAWLKGGRKVHRANQRLADILGYDSYQDLIGMSVEQFHLTRQRFEEFGKIFYNALMNRDLSQLEYQFRRKDGSAVWISLSGKALDETDPPDLAKGVLWVADDISERKKSEQRLMRMATIDELTGTYNRRHFMEVSRHEVCRKERYGHPLSLLMLDIDHFKLINDEFGHEAGDRALMSFCGYCRKELRSVDIFGRLGGEEFAVLLPETSLGKAVTVADRIRETIDESSARDAANVHMTVSIGITSAMDSLDSIENILQRADKALYSAKHKGRNRVECW